MSKVTVAGLAGAQETLLIPLWARAVESRRPEPMLVDRKAVEMVETIDYDFDKFAGRVSALNYCSRAVVMDRVIRDVLQRHPAATVVEIGVGLDGRFDRLDNGTVRWFELDMPEVIDVRRQFYQETSRRTFLPYSVLDEAWMPLVAASRPGPLLLIAEGVFYFLTEGQLRGLFGSLADRFPGSQLVFDSQSPLYILYSRLTHPLAGSKLKWSIGNVRRIERWDPRLKVEEAIGFGDSPHYDGHLRRFPLVHRLARALFPPIRRAFVVTRLRLGQPSA